MDMVDISIGDAAVTALLGYAVVFIGIVILMAVIILMGRLMNRKPKAVPAGTVAVQETAVNKTDEPGPAAKGTAGELKLYDTDPRDAAMIMAIVADSLHKPLNELRFISIREVKDDEV